MSADDPSSDAWRRAFVDFMARLADQAAPKQLHEQRFVFTVHGESFRHALSLAEKLGMDSDFAALTQSLAAFALNTRNFAAAERLFEQLGRRYAARGNADGESAAYHQLGRVAEERRDFDCAEQWYLKSLAIEEKQGNEHGAATTYGQLGILARLRGEPERAGAWLLKAIVVFTRLSDSHRAQIAINNYLDIYRDADSALQPRLQALWVEAGLGPMPE